MIYQICIPSFYDSNNDGIGDINGIIQKLPYIKYLGIDAIYLNPITVARCFNNNDSYIKDRFIGYESVNLKCVDPRYGTIEDYIRLIHEAHKINVKIIIDFITIGVSPKHEYWESIINRSSQVDRNFFIIRDNPEEGPWLNYHGKPWNLMPDGSYYYSLWKDWPSFNYNNPKVVEYVLSVADFWLEKGTDGFRLDAAKFLFVNGPGFDLQEHQPQTIEFWKQFKKYITKRYGDEKVLLAEVIPFPLNYDYIGKKGESIDLLYDGTFAEELYNSKLIDTEDFISNYFNAKFNETNSTSKLIYQSNHDRGRISARVIENNNDKNKLLAGLLLLSNGIPLVYYGDEIGIQGTPLGNELDYISTMCWNTSINGGFSEVGSRHPSISTDYCCKNVANQKSDPKSLLSYYKQLILLRNKYTVFAQGKRLKIRQDNPKVYSYFLYQTNKVVLVIHNLSPLEEMYELKLNTYTDKSSLVQMFPIDKIKYSVTNTVLRVKLQGYLQIVFLLEEASSQDLRLNKIDILNLVNLRIGDIISETRYSSMIVDKPEDRALLNTTKQLINIKTFGISMGKELISNYSLHINLQKNSLIPFSSDTKFCLICKGGDLRLVSFSWKSYFDKILQNNIYSPGNMNLVSFGWFHNEAFWYFKIEKKQLLLPKNGGLDFIVVFHDPNKTNSLQELFFWNLPKIFFSKSIDTIIIYQDGHREKKPILYSQLTKSRQPGVKYDNEIIFQARDEAFYLIVNKSILNSPSYEVALLVWSAGGNWGEPRPKLSPILERLPSTQDSKGSLPNVVNDFVTIS